MKKILILAVIIILIGKIIKSIIDKDKDKPEDAEKQSCICPICSVLYNYVSSFAVCLFMRKKGTRG